MSDKSERTYETYQIYLWYNKSTPSVIPDPVSRYGAGPIVDPRTKINKNGRCCFLFSFLDSRFRWNDIRGARNYLVLRLYGYAHKD